MKKMSLNAGFIILSAILVFASCSDNDDDERNKEIKDPSVKLVSSKSTIVPFEDIKVSVTTDLELLYENYDSIVWKANGVAYSGFFFSNSWTGDEDRDIRITDYRFGDNKVYALGYKDGIVISEDSITYTVEKPNGNFLDINWNSGKTQNTYQYYTTGMTPNNYLPTVQGHTKIGGVSLELNHIVADKDMEYATLRFTPWSFETNMKSKRTKATMIPDVNDFDWNREDNEDYDGTDRYQIEYEFHMSYMTELYGSPEDIYEGSDITVSTLLEKYSSKFKYTESMFYPAAIWETASTVICLLQANNRIGGQNQRGICKIVAEPRK